MPASSRRAGITSSPCPRSPSGARALVIFDEVISFRLGWSGAQGLWGIEPDLTALGKIIGGGFPVGAVGGRAEIMAVFDPTGGKPALPHGGTFTANPVTMRAGLASMRTLTKESFAHLDGLGASLQRRRRRFVRKAWPCRPVRGPRLAVQGSFHLASRYGLSLHLSRVRPSGRSSTPSTRACSAAACSPPATACSRCRRR
ncbi:aminotransferase class III-fold pyridoxal phosphate-dependent enzyme [Mesorhizobium atlanticum]